MSETLRKWLPWIAVAVMALVLVTVVIANRGDSEPTAADTTTSAVETTTTVIETTTTTEPAKTTTTVIETTTTAPAETTTTTAPPDTTTTTAVAPGTVALTDEGIYADETWIHFGFDDEAAIAAVTTVLGAPTDDSGWVDGFSSPYGVCPPPVVRGVHWGSLTLLFTQADSDFWSAGVPHFFAYNYFANEPPVDLQTTEGITVGDSIGMLRAAYPGPDLVIDESPFDPAAGIWFYDQQSWTGMWGYANGQTDAHVITSINGGQGCGE
jgi:hypothetical protein